MSSLSLTGAGLTSGVAALAANGGVVTTLAGSFGNVWPHVNAVTDWVDGTGSDARFRLITMPSVDPVGNIWVGDGLNDGTSFRKITPAGAVTSLVGRTGGATYGSVNGVGLDARVSPSAGGTGSARGVLAWSTDGCAYFTDTDPTRTKVRKYDPATNTVSAFVGQGDAYVDGDSATARFSFLTGAIAADENGNLYVADNYGLVIRKITPAGDVSTFAGPTTILSAQVDGFGLAVRFNGAQAIASDRNGFLYVASRHAVRKINISTGEVTTFAGSVTAGFANGTGAAARFYYPTGICVHPLGNVYVTELTTGAPWYGGQTVRQITPAGVVTTFAGLNDSRGSTDGTGSSARFYSPVGIACNQATGDMYVSEQNSAYTLRKIT